jgi:hypothetical protein
MTAPRFLVGQMPVARDASDAAWHGALDVPFDQSGEAMNVAALLAAGLLVPRPADWTVPLLCLPHTHQ